MAMQSGDRQKLIEDMMAEQVDAQTAELLVDEVPDVVRRQLAYLDYQDEQDDRAATLVASIEGDWPEPTRSYWANVAKQYSDPAGEDAPASTPPAIDSMTEQEVNASQEANVSEEATARHQPQYINWDEVAAPEPEAPEPEAAQMGQVAAQPQPDAQVQALLNALESIATMQHAHRAQEPCPVCVAWDALKEWSHAQGTTHSPDNL